MKDFLGQEVKVGDTILYVDHGIDLMRGVIKDINGDIQISVFNGTTILGRYLHQFVKVNS